MESTVLQSIESSIDVKAKMLKDVEFIKSIENTANLMVESYKNRGKMLLCGNGGSAGDAQHIAAELTGRFYKDRAPLDAEALHVNSSYLTAVANDYGYDEVYARMVNARGQKGDVFVAISTSGNSPNVVKATEAAKYNGIITIGLTGKSGGKLDELCDYCLKVPSNDTPRIQEAHILIGHIWCEIIENSLF